MVEYYYCKTIPRLHSKAKDILEGGDILNSKQNTPDITSKAKQITL